MRWLLPLLLVAAACAADPVLLPDAAPADAGPCSSVCGAGTVCVGGACVVIEAGAVDAPPSDMADDRMAPADLAPADAGFDVGADDVGARDVGTDVPTAEGGVDAEAPRDVLPDGCSATTVGNCCGVACAPPNGVGACLGGACVIGACAAGFADCDGVAASGCETNTQTSVTHCGACGAPCAAGRLCVAGSCIECPTGRAVCGGICHDTQSDIAHCGTCDRVCPARPNATATCAAGACGFTCASGFADCDGNPVNGCEVDTRVSLAHCGACRSECPARAHSSRTCAAGVCGVACAMGYGNCDGVASNGCETDLSTDRMNCTACGTVCAFCAVGVCIP